MCCGTSIGLILSPRHLYRRTGTSWRGQVTDLAEKLENIGDAVKLLDGSEVC